MSAYKRVYHRKDFTGAVNNKRVYCPLCGVRHYAARYHYCVYKPNLLDLYCCSGGAAMGFYQAGFNITGVDIKQRKNYPFTFIQGDAIEYLKEHAREYHYCHASPPCQNYSRSTHVHKQKGKTYVDLVDPTRQALNASGLPWDMENVLQAPMRRDLVLRGEMFGLKVIRKRAFEFGGGMVWDKPAPAFTPISVAKGEALIIYGNASLKPTGHGCHGDPGRRIIRPDWLLPTIRQSWAYAMGITHYMTDREIAESIPPEYTRYIGAEVIQKLKFKS